MKRLIVIIFMVVVAFAFGCCYQSASEGDSVTSSTNEEEAESDDSGGSDGSDGEWESDVVVGESYDSSYLDSLQLSMPWAEIPSIDADTRYQYVTHFTELDSGEQLRNYSLCYDTQSFGAVWVAYPYHAVYDGDSGRSSSWRVDPSISDYLQPALTSSYQSSLYDRGHQIPSADRQATTTMNQATFYYSNSTPQLARLNQQKWADLEEQVRAQVCSDTLYVVTGAYYKNSTQTTADAVGNQVALPTAYFKALLRTRSGRSGKSIAECDADELQAIGFWVEHQYYSTLPAPISVAEVESLSGLELFPMLPSSVKQSFDIDDWDLKESLFDL